MIKILLLTLLFSIVYSQIPIPILNSNLSLEYNINKTLNGINFNQNLICQLHHSSNHSNDHISLDTVFIDGSTAIITLLHDTHHVIYNISCSNDGYDWSKGNIVSIVPHIEEISKKEITPETKTVYVYGKGFSNDSYPTVEFNYNSIKSYTKLTVYNSTTASFQNQNLEFNGLYVLFVSNDAISYSLSAVEFNNEYTDDSLDGGKIFAIVISVIIGIIIIITFIIVFMRMRKRSINNIQHL